MILEGVDPPLAVPGTRLLADALMRHLPDGEGTVMQHWIGIGIMLVAAVGLLPGMGTAAGPPEASLLGQVAALAAKVAALEAQVSALQQQLTA